MAYKIKITNKFGTFYSRNFRDKKQAMGIIKKNRVADKFVNSQGFKNIKGNPIKMNNKYRLVNQ